jgi:hypothetical protein
VRGVGGDAEVALAVSRARASSIYCILPGTNKAIKSNGRAGRGGGTDWLRLRRPSSRHMQLLPRLFYCSAAGSGYGRLWDIT